MSIIPGNKLTLHFHSKNTFFKKDMAALVISPFKVTVKDMTMSSRVATLLSNGQSTIAELSLTLGISRQATHKAVKNLEDNGYIQLTPTPDKPKIKIITLTASGEKAFMEREKLLKDIENQIANKIGKGKLRTLKEILALDWT